MSIERCYSLRAAAKLSLEFPEVPRGSKVAHVNWMPLRPRKAGAA